MGSSPVAVTYTFVWLTKLKPEISLNLKLIRPGVYMASIDLKDAFFSVPIHKTTKPTWHFFRGIFEICMYAKWIWTSHANIYKNFKKMFFILGEKGFLSVVYVDDWYLQGDNYEDCFSNVLNTKEIRRFLGFTIHPEKSEFIPTQCISYLGFILNSVQMTVTLTL